MARTCNTADEKCASGAQAGLESGPLTKGGLSKTHRDYWTKRIFKPTYARHGATIEARNWAVEIQHRGDRRRLSLGTPNKHAAVDRAKNLYMDVVTNGWAEAYAEVRPELRRQEIKRDGRRVPGGGHGDGGRQ